MEDFKIKDKKINIKILESDFALKTYNYNVKKLKNGLIKSIDNNDYGFLLVDVDKKMAFKFESIYLGTLMLETGIFFWGNASNNLLEEMKDKTQELINVGKKENILELIEGLLIVYPHIVERQKELSFLNPDNKEYIDNMLCSRYTVSELVAIGAEILNADSHIVLDFPEQKFKSIYLLYGEPVEIKL